MKIKILLSSFSLLTLGLLQSQVTIGSSFDPDGSALLDIKDQSNGTSTKGLLLPRFTITNPNSFGLEGNTQTAGMTVYSPANAGNSGAGIYTWTGAGGQWSKSLQSSDIPLPINVVPTDAGTLIAVNGKLETAQEISWNLSANYSYTNSMNASAIGNINKVFDNKNTMTATASTNSFTVTTTGIYQLTMNVQVSCASNSQAPTIGIWDNTGNGWVARLNDAYTISGNRQTVTFFTALTLTAGRSYSFSFANGIATTLYANGNGAGYVSYGNLRRIN